MHTLTLRKYRINRSYLYFALEYICIVLDESENVVLMKGFQKDKSVLLHLSSDTVGHSHCC